MKTLIIYNSTHHGNTEKIAKVMAEILNAELVKPDEVDITTLSKYDLIGFGSGIYHDRHHKSLFEVINKLDNQKGKRAFIFSTSGIKKTRFFHEFDKALKKKLLGKGFRIIGEFNCRGWDTYPFWVKPFGGVNKGKPDEKDLENARSFAKVLKRIFESDQSGSVFSVNRRSPQGNSVVNFK